MNEQSMLQFKTLPNSCVFVILSDLNKVCYIGHSGQLKARIGQIMDEYDLNKYTDVRLEVLGSFEDKEYKQIFAEHYKQKYRDLGFNVVNGDVQYMSYKYKLVPNYFHKKINVVVENKRKEKKLIAVFNNYVQAEEYCDWLNDTMGIVQPVCAINKDTVDWFSGLKYKRSSKIELK